MFPSCRCVAVERHQWEKSVNVIIIRSLFQECHKFALSYCSSFMSCAVHVASKSDRGIIVLWPWWSPPRAFNRTCFRNCLNYPDDHDDALHKFVFASQWPENVHIEGKAGVLKSTCISRKLLFRCLKKKIRLSLSHQGAFLLHRLFAHKREQLLSRKFVSNSRRRCSGGGSNVACTIPTNHLLKTPFTHWWRTSETAFNRIIAVRELFSS